MAGRAVASVYQVTGVYEVCPCPDSALLAAFIEGGLKGDDRTAVVSHLAECDQCRGVAVCVVAVQEMRAVDPMWGVPVATAPAVLRMPAAPVSRWRWHAGRATAAAWALAAATALAAAVALHLHLQVDGFGALPLARLLAAAEGERPIEARLAGGFAYAAPDSSVPPDRTGSARLLTVATTLRESLEDAGDADARRARGVAALLVGDLDDAVADLAVAAAVAPSDAQIANDLAAAYYERAVRRDRPDDLPRALSAVERALAQAPRLREAWFNRALIVTALGLASEARQSWSAYLDRDDTGSPWAAEARDRAETIHPSRAAAEWAALRREIDESGADVTTADRAVRAHTSRARQYLELDLFAAWVAAVRSGRDEQPVLATMRAMAGSFMRLTGDRLYVDALTVIERARARDARRYAAIVAAHESFLQAVAIPANRKDARSPLATAAAGLAHVGSPLAGRARIEMAAADYYAGRLPAAAAAVAAVKEQARRAEYPSLVMRALWMEGLAAQGLNDVALAQQAYEERLQLANAIGDVEHRGSSQLLLANLHDLLGDTAIAWRYRIDATAAIGEVSAGLSQVILLSAAGDAAGAGDFAAALVFESATGAYQARTNPITEAQGRAQHARTLEAVGRLAEAERELVAARTLLAGANDSVVEPRLRADLLITEAQLREHRDPAAAAAAAQQAASLLSLDREPLRIARVHAMAAAALVAAGALDAADRAASNGIAALERARQLPGAGIQIASSDPAWSVYQTASDLAARRGDTDRAFALDEQQRLRTPFERRLWADRVLSLDRLRQGLADDTAVAVVAQRGDAVQVSLIRREGTETHRAPIPPWRGASMVAAHLQEVRRGAAAPHASGDLFDAIVRPFVPALASVRTIVVVADAPYNRIAFSGLWDRSRNEYLVEHHALVAAPSATAFAWAASRAALRPASRGDGAVIVQASSRRPTAGYAGSDHEHLAAVYRGADLRRGDAATPARLLADVGEREIVHVAAPLVSNAEFPSWSRLLLADSPNRKYSGAVLAERLAERELSRVRLVALDGTTDRASLAQGDGALGFVGALLVAGVPNVVGPVADVNVAKVERTWIEFHRHYAAGLSATESLRAAQLTSLAESRRRLGPWAALAVFGSSR